TVAYLASTGHQLWVDRYDGPGNGDDFANSLGVSPDGAAVFVTGSSIGSTGAADYATIAYDTATGDKLWVRRYDGPASSDDAAHSLAVSPDGGAVFVTGLSTGSAGDFDYATVAYDASTGGKLWVRRYTGPGNGTDEAYSLGVAP